MNNRFETRARQNRTTALFLTFLFHVALVGGIYFYNLNKDSEKKTESITTTTQEASAKPVANVKRNHAKP
jgi:hypothetical protein